jgi:hypothetical protein
MKIKMREKESTKVKMKPKDHQKVLAPQKILKVPRAYESLNPGLIVRLNRYFNFLFKSFFFKLVYYNTEFDSSHFSLSPFYD